MWGLPPTGARKEYFYQMPFAGIGFRPYKLQILRRDFKEFTCETQTIYSLYITAHITNKRFRLVQFTVFS